MLCAPAEIYNDRTRSPPRAREGTPEIKPSVELAYRRQLERPYRSVVFRPSNLAIS